MSRVDDTRVGRLFCVRSLISGHRYGSGLPIERGLALCAALALRAARLQTKAEEPRAGKGRLCWGEFYCGKRHITLAIRGPPRHDWHSQRSKRSNFRRFSWHFECRHEIVASEIVWEIRFLHLVRL